jgi:3-hydroxy acid dehydrogenase / malonic semialdehyde reductase
MARLEDKVVFVTGASSGIGAACARVFAREGARLLLAARRAERIESEAPALREAGAADVLVLPLDTRDAAAVKSAIDALPEPFRAVEVLVNNAGLSRGLDRLHEGSLEDWNEMIDTNVKGLLHVDRAVVPLMVARRRGTVVHIGSIAGRQTYPGGNVYCATKSAVHALAEGLRLDLLGTGVRVTSVEPGMVLTEFSEVRFHGDRDRAAGVYRGVVPLSAEDVADAVLFVATRPDHVQIAEMVVLPTDQASATHVHRRG